MRKIKKGDNVVVIAGRDKGKRGDVTRVLAEHVPVEVEDRLSCARPDVHLDLVVDEPGAAQALSIVSEIRSRFVAATGMPPADYAVEKPLSGYSEALRRIKAGLHEGRLPSIVPIATMSNGPAVASRC